MKPNISVNDRILLEHGTCTNAKLKTLTYQILKSLKKVVVCEDDWAPLHDLNDVFLLARVFCRKYDYTLKIEEHKHKNVINSRTGTERDYSATLRKDKDLISYTCGSQAEAILRAVGCQWAQNESWKAVRILQKPKQIPKKPKKPSRSFSGYQSLPNYLMDNGV